MKLSCKLYGCMGIISLLGFIGVFTDERQFLSFFAFAVNFEYLFVKSDEMIIDYLNKSAAFAFYCGTIIMAVVTLVYYLCIDQNGSVALIKGLALGWAGSIFINAILVASYSIKEKLGAVNDN